MIGFLTLIGIMIIEIFGVLLVLCALTWLMYTEKKVPNIVRICLAVFVTFSTYIIMGTIVKIKAIDLGVFVIAVVSIIIGFGFKILDNVKKNNY